MYQSLSIGKCGGRNRGTVKVIVELSHYAESVIKKFEPVRELSNFVIRFEGYASTSKAYKRFIFKDRCRTMLHIMFCKGQHGVFAGNDCFTGRNPIKYWIFLKKADSC